MLFQNDVVEKLASRAHLHHYVNVLLVFKGLVELDNVGVIEFPEYLVEKLSSIIDLFLRNHLDDSPLGFVVLPL